MQLAISLWLPLFLAPVTSAQGATCYNAFGTPIIWDTAACDLSATGTAGSHSHCCNTAQEDVCLSSGLCLASWATGRDQMLWVGGCTDRTWQDPACWRLCGGGSDQTAGDGATSHLLKSCSNDTWCCHGVFDFQESNGNQQGDCCSKAFAIKDGIGTAVRQMTSGRPGPTSGSSGGSNTATVTSSNPTASGNGPAATCAPNSGIGAMSTGDGSDSKMVAIIGGVLGAALAASLIAVGLLGFSNWKLRKQIRQGAPVAGTTTSTAGYHDSKSSPPTHQVWPGIPHTATELSATDRTPELDASQRVARRK